MLPREYINDPKFIILMVVRDPRAIFASRKRLLGTYDLSEMESLCRTWRLFIDQRKEWAAKSVIVRYEDFAKGDFVALRGKNRRKRSPGKPENKIG